MRQALECCHKGWGQSIIIGVAPRRRGDLDAAVPARHRPRNGKARPSAARAAAPTCRSIVDWYMDGKIAIDELITHRLKLDEINDGFELMKRGESIRSVVVY